MLTTCLFLPTISSAQNELDALRYSQVFHGSTARSTAMGGAFGALGGDYSCLSTNPAGLGIYRKSDFSFSLGFTGREYESDFQGSRRQSDRFDIDMPNLGVVLASGSKKPGIGSGIAFGIAYNRLASFNNSIEFKGRNDGNSILDSFTEEIALDGGVDDFDIYDFYPFGAGLAYNTYLINPTQADTFLYDGVIPNGGVTQSMVIESNGSMGELSLGLAGRIEETFMVGLSLSFPNIEYEELKTYTETDEEGTVFVADTSLLYRDFKSLKYENYLKTTGNGFNMKLGAIFQPIDWLRTGLAIHTPTWFFMSDIYNSKMQSVFSNNRFEDFSPDGNYTYRLRTSWRTIASLGFIFGKSGLLSLEGELVQYPRAKLGSSDYNFMNENQIIKTVYKSSTFNFRAGGEWRYEPFSLRAGAAYYGTPFNDAFTNKVTDQSTWIFSGGAGYRGKKYYFDFAFVYYERGESISPYYLSYEPTPAATAKRFESRVVTTFGWKF